MTRGAAVPTTGGRRELFHVPFVTVPPAWAPIVTTSQTFAQAKTVSTAVVCNEYIHDKYDS